MKIYYRNFQQSNSNPNPTFLSPNFYPHPRNAPKKFSPSQSHLNWRLIPSLDHLISSIWAEFSPIISHSLRHYGRPKINLHHFYFFLDLLVYFFIIIWYLCITRCGAACYAHCPPIYTIKVNNVILYTSLWTIIRIKMCCKDIKMQELNMYK